MKLKDWQVAGLAVVAAVILQCGATAQAAAIALRQGVNGYAGNYVMHMLENYPAQVRGGFADFDLGSWVGGAGGTRTRALLRFDLSSIVGMGVESASLQMTNTGKDDSGGAWNSTLTLYRVSAANKAWVGTTAYANAPGSNGYPGWGYLNYNTVAWAGSVGLTTAGTDYIATPVATAAISSTDAIGTVYTLAFTDVSFLSDWAGNPANNAGFLLTIPGLEPSRLQALFLGGAQNATVGNRPLLTIVPEPASVALAGLCAGCLLARRRARASRPTLA